MEERGLVPMKGKGDVLTYWLNGVTDKAIKRVKKIDFPKLPTLFSKPKVVGGNHSEQVTRRERKSSPRMSIIPSDLRNSTNHRHSANVFENGGVPDSPCLPRHRQTDNGSATTLDSTTGNMNTMPGVKLPPSQIEKKSIAAKLLSGNFKVFDIFVLLN